eukprot:scaffold11637_cov111-Isochrysis_galbana.AAC.2
MDGGRLSPPVASRLQEGRPQQGLPASGCHWQAHRTAARQWLSFGVALKHASAREAKGGAAHLCPARPSMPAAATPPRTNQPSEEGAWCMPGQGAPAASPSVHIARPCSSVVGHPCSRGCLSQSIISIQYYVSVCRGGVCPVGTGAMLDASSSSNSDVRSMCVYACMVYTV